MKVLVVDDSMFMRDILKEILTKLPGIEIVGEAKDGREGFEKYKELQPDLVTMDIIMGDDSGLDALENIMAYDQDATVVMVSSVGQEKYVTQCIDNGAKGFIIKPFTEAQVISTIQEIIR